MRAESCAHLPIVRASAISGCMRSHCDDHHGEITLVGPHLCLICQAGLRKRGCSASTKVPRKRDMSSTSSSSPPRAHAFATTCNMGEACAAEECMHRSGYEMMPRGPD